MNADVAKCEVDGLGRAAGQLLHRVDLAGAEITTKLIASRARILWAAS